MRRLSDPKNISKEVDRLFDRLVHRGWQERSEPWIPSVELSDTNGEYILEIELPGVSLDDIEISIQGNIISVSGSRRCSNTQVSAWSIYSERKYGYFQRILVMPQDADMSKFEKSFKDGVLRLYFKKLSKFYK